jgi:hypothetical protein
MAQINARYRHAIRLRLYGELSYVHPIDRPLLFFHNPFLP